VYTHTRESWLGKCCAVLTEIFVKKKKEREKRTENLSPFSLALLPFPSVVTADARPSQFIASIIRFSDFATFFM
jgi:hypothetical protein